MENMSRRMVRRADVIGVLFALILLVPGRALCQNYVFGPNKRVNTDPPGTAPHWTYSPGQHLIACRGDTVYLVWRGDEGGNSHIYFARSDDAGQSFGANVRVDNTSSGCVGIIPSLAVDDSGEIHVCWLNYNAAGNAFTYYAKSTDGGQTFLSPVRACDSLYSTQAASPSIAVSKSGRYVFVVRSESWYDTFPPSTYQIKLSRSTDGGTTFITPNTLVLADTVVWMLDPSVTVFSDTTVLVACDSHTQGGAHSAVLLAKSRNGGQTFSSAALLSGADGSDPSIASDTLGRVYAAWGSGLGGIAYAVSENQGDTFSHELPVPQTHGAMYVSLWVSRGGRLYLAWWLFGTGFPDIRFCCSSDAGQTFSEPVNPSDGTDSVWETYPTVCANDAGRAFMAWEDNRNELSGHNDDIYFATGTLAAVGERKPQQSPAPTCEVFPNPSRGKVWLDYALTSPGRTRILVSDAAGRFVVALVNQQERSGRHVCIWNGWDTRATAVSSGVYFIRVQTPEGETTRKVQIVRD